MTHAKLEVCVDNAQSLDMAIKGGADRIELCSALALGGLTPSAGFMELAAKSSVPVRVMIRPRECNFCYSADEITQMKSDISLVRKIGLHGVVLGAATAQGMLDVAILKELLVCASPMPATLHRVVDTLNDPVAAVDAAIGLGFDTILTSGGKPNVDTGCATIARMVAKSSGRIGIMPGAGVRTDNAATILKSTGSAWLHASCIDAGGRDENPQSIDFFTKHPPVSSLKTCQELSEICRNTQLF